MVILHCPNELLHIGIYSFSVVWFYFSCLSQDVVFTVVYINDVMYAGLTTLL